MSSESLRNVPRAERFPAPVRAVIDTGVLRSAVWGGRSSTTVIDAWLEGRVVFCVTETLMSGYFSSLVRIPPTPIVDSVLAHLRSGEGVRAFLPAPGSAPAYGPPEDALVWCARQAEAEAVVTHDTALLDLGQVGGTAMLTPGAFVRRFLVS
jgi:predicted nucleic acid-binding protein